jgi:hypothetical protein
MAARTLGTPSLSNSTYRRLTRSLFDSIGTGSSPDPQTQTAMSRRILGQRHCRFVSAV